uniref:F-box domain-containing protein n=1 Tax=Arundo donax TaxID=35708 RepID=A0A0A9AAL8_ARUDO
MLEEQEGTLNQLPEDVLANILRRLAPRCLATSRCVCKPWCTIIDTRRLLRSDLLPLSVAGIFINFHGLVLSEFFSRSSTGPTLSDYLPFRGNFRDHCNGLLLLHNYVVNPATRQWVQLPPRPSPHLGTKNFFHKEYLVFDPTLSPHYEVFLIPHASAVSGWFNSDIKLNPAIEELEWPLSPCILHVFSSRTEGWEERSFVREGEAAGTVADMRLDGSYGYHCHNAVYWRGALYVHCQTNFVMRISLLDGKYQVIKPPADIELTPNPKLYLGGSQKGVYCALDDYYVYILDESYGKMEWVRKASISLRHRQTDRPKPWTLQDINYGGSHDEYQDGNDEVIMEQKFEWGFDNNNAVETKEWDSDNDNVIDTEGWGNSNFGGDITFLGFHPYKEVVFLSEGLSRGVAYHLNSSKVQDLGNLSPTHYGTCMGIEPFIKGSFPYTPWMGEFPEEN